MNQSNTGEIPLDVEQLLRNGEKTIIALQGRSGTGKTTTLRMLIEKVKKTYNTTIKEICHDAQKDLYAIAEINGKKVGITTRGDTEWCLKIDFEKMGNCQLYVCACRTKGDTVKFIEKQAENGLLVYHGKWYYKSNNKNFKDEEHIINKINQSQVDVIYKEMISLLQT